MTDVETVARALAAASDALWDAANFNHTLGGETPEEMRDSFMHLAAAALAAATPLIEARVREECIAAVRGESFRRPPHSPRDEGYEHALTDAEAAIRKGRP